MNIGGTSHYIGELVAGIPNSVLATGNVQGAEREDETVNHIEVIRIPHLGRKISPLNDYKSWLELKRVVSQFQPDIVHTHTFKAGLVGRLTPGQHKSVHTYHGHLFNDTSFSGLAQIAIKVIERYLARKTDLLISVGKKVGEELRQAGIGQDKKWISIAPGVNQLPQYEKKFAREQLGLPVDGFLVGWMARVTNVKNPQLLLEVARMLPDLDFVVAGGGDLLKIIEKEKGDNVRILGWTDAAIFWSAVDCAISTSLSEGMPIALIEAQLAGLPIIATDVGSNSEFITNGETGFISQIQARDLANYLAILAHDQKLRLKMGKTAQTRAFQDFSIQKMLADHQKVYETLG